MDAVEFLREKTRMCDSFGTEEHSCETCRLSHANNGTRMACSDFIYKSPEMAVSIVEKWSKEHPRKTRLTDFLEKHPKAPLCSKGYPKACADYSGYTDICIHDCSKCWNTPLEDTK